MKDFDLENNTLQNNYFYTMFDSNIIPKVCIFQEKPMEITSDINTFQEKTYENPNIHIYVITSNLNIYHATIKPVRIFKLTKDLQQKVYFLKWNS